MADFDIAMARKLNAMRMVARHLGMYGIGMRPAALNVDPDLLDESVRGAIVGLMEPGRLWWQRAACAAILDVAMPGWRLKARPEVLGLVVEREGPEVRKWRSAVLKRDGYACTQCGATERLEAHHIVRWADCPEARVIVDNGVTLCKACHIVEHKKA